MAITRKATAVGQLGTRAALWIAAAALILTGSVCNAQLPTPGQCPTQNRDRITAYKFLAELTYHRVQSGRYETATIAAKNLEFTWDQTNGCFQTLGVSHKETLKIDELMDGFIEPVAQWSESKDSSGDITQITAAYKRYVAELDGLR